MMKNRLSKLLLVALFVMLFALVLTVSAGAADPTYVAEAGGTQYTTLAEAVGATTDGTVTLLSDAAGDGIVIPSGSNITLELGGFTYTVDGETVGSGNTKTNGFQILQGATVTIRNGTIKSEKAKLLIQNYADSLTLDDVDLIGGTVTEYVLSNNAGTTTLANGTTITATEGNVAFDVAVGWSAAYTAAIVNVEDATIVGEIEVGNYGTTADNIVLNLNGGNLTGATITTMGDGGNVTKDAAVEVAPPAGSAWDASGNIVTAVAEVNGYGYATWAEAKAAWEADCGTLKLLGNVDASAVADAGCVHVTAGESMTLDLNGYKLTVRANGGCSVDGSNATHYVRVAGGTFAVTDSSTGKNGVFSFTYGGNSTAMLVEVISGTFNMDAGTLTNESTLNYGGSAFYVRANGTANMTGGAVVVTDAAGMRVYPVYNNSGAVTLENVTITAAQTISNSGTMTIENSTISGKPVPGATYVGNIVYDGTSTVAQAEAPAAYTAKLVRDGVTYYYTAAGAGATLIKDAKNGDVITVTESPVITTSVKNNGTVITVVVENGATLEGVVITPATYCETLINTADATTTFTVAATANTALAKAETAEGVVTYHVSIANAAAAAGNGGTVTMLQDYTGTSTQTIYYSITLDLNGHTISINKGHATTYYGAIEVDAASDTYGDITLTIVDGMGNGAVINTGNSDTITGYALYVGGRAGHKILVQAGTYTGPIAQVLGTIEITGGTFYVDPSTYVPTDYKVVDNGDNTFAVVAKDYHVQVNNSAKFETLQEAVDAAASGDTINLLKDQTLAATVTISKNLTIAGDGVTVTAGTGLATMFTVSGTAEVTFSGDVTYTTAVGHIFNTPNAACTVVINTVGGTYTATGSDHYVYNMTGNSADSNVTVNINGGTYSAQHNFMRNAAKTIAITIGGGAKISGTNHVIAFHRENANSVSQAQVTIKDANTEVILASGSGNVFDVNNGVVMTVTMTNGLMETKGSGNVINLQGAKTSGSIEVSGGTLKANTGAVLVIGNQVVNGVTIALKGGALSSAGSSSAGAIVMDAGLGNTTVTVAGATLTNTKGWAIDFEGSSSATTKATKKVVMSSGKIEAQFAIVYNYGGVTADVDITGGEIKAGNTAVYINNMYVAANNNVANVDISGLTFNGSVLIQQTTTASHAVINLGNGNNVTVTNRVVAAYKGEASKNLAQETTVNFTGGTYKATANVVYTQGTVANITVGGNAKLESVDGHTFACHRELTDSVMQVSFTVKDTAAITHSGTAGHNIIDMNNGVSAVVNISGGTWTNKGNSQYSNFVDIAAGTTTLDVDITGGTFTGMGCLVSTGAPNSTVDISNANYEATLANDNTGVIYSAAADAGVTANITGGSFTCANGPFVGGSGNITATISGNTEITAKWLTNANGASQHVATVKDNADITLTHALSSDGSANSTVAINQEGGSLSAPKYTSSDSMTTVVTIDFVGGTYNGIKIDEAFYNETKNTVHATLQAAIDAAADGDVIVIRRDLNAYTSTINVNKSVTIKGGTAAVPLTIKFDAAAVGKVDTAINAFNIAAGVNVTFDGYFKLIDASFVVGTGAADTTLTLQGNISVVDTTSVDPVYIPAGHGNVTVNVKDNVSITGKWLINFDDNTTDSSGKKTVNITGGTFKGNYAVVFNMENVEVEVNASGATFTTNNDAFYFCNNATTTLHVAADNIFNVTGRVVYINHSANNVMTNVVIDGGTYNGAIQSIVYNVRGSLNLTIKSGTYKVTKVGEGVRAAVAVYKATTATVVVETANITTTGANNELFFIDGTVDKIDLTIKAGTYITEGKARGIYNNSKSGKVTLGVADADNTALTIKTGTKVTDNGSQQIYASHTAGNSFNLLINSGTFYTAGENVIDINASISGTITIHGGDFDCNDGYRIIDVDGNIDKDGKTTPCNVDVTITGGDFCTKGHMIQLDRNNGDVTITGGTFVSDKSFLWLRGVVGKVTVSDVTIKAGANFLYACDQETVSSKVVSSILTLDVVLEDVTAECAGDVWFKQDSITDGKSTIDIEIKSGSYKMLAYTGDVSGLAKSGRAFFRSGDATIGGFNVTIQSGTFTGVDTDDYFTSMFLNQGDKATLTINGGAFTGFDTIVWAGRNGQSKKFTVTVPADSTATFGAKYFVYAQPEAANKNNSDGTVTIAGGTYNITTMLVYVENLIYTKDEVQKTATATINVTVSGGTFATMERLARAMSGTLALTINSGVDIKTTGDAISSAAAATDLTVTINGGKVESTTNAIFSIQSKATVTLDGGELKAATIGLWSNSTNLTVYINDVQITAGNDGISLGGSAVATIQINGGTIKAGGRGIYVDATGGKTVNITAIKGSITATKEVVFTENESSGTSTVNVTLQAGTYHSDAQRVLYVNVEKGDTVFGVKDAANDLLKLSTDAKLQIFAHHSDPKSFSLTVYSGTYTAKSNLVDINGNSTGTITIHGGDFTVTTGDDLFDVDGNNSHVDITVHGGKFTSGGRAFHANTSGGDVDIVINGGTFDTTGHGILMQAGTNSLTINGGTINAKMAGIRFEKGTFTVNLNGGSVTSTGTVYAESEAVFVDDGVAGMTMTVKAGTYKAGASGSASSRTFYLRANGTYVFGDKDNVNVNDKLSLYSGNAQALAFHGAIKTLNLTIYGGTFETVGVNNNIDVNSNVTSGTITVNGGDFNTVSGHFIDTEGDISVVVNNADVASTGNNSSIFRTYDTTASLTVNGGTFNMKAYAFKIDGKSDVTILVTGDTTNIYSAWDLLMVAGGSSVSAVVSCGTLSVNYGLIVANAGLKVLDEATGATSVLEVTDKANVTFRAVGIESRANGVGLLKISGGTVTANHVIARAYLLENVTGNPVANLQISGGTITHTKNTIAAAQTETWKNSADLPLANRGKGVCTVNVVISGGTLTSTLSDANTGMFYATNNSFTPDAEYVHVVNATITGGKITCTNGPVAGGEGITNVTISGGEITTKYLSNANGAISKHTVNIEGTAKVVVTDCLATDGGAGSVQTINLKGGELTAAKMLSAYPMTSTVILNMTGGSYNGLPYITNAEGFVASIGNNFYSTFEAAVEAAANGDTITLLASFSINATVTINKTLTITGGAEGNVILVNVNMPIAPVNGTFNTFELATGANLTVSGYLHFYNVGFRLLTGEADTTLTLSGNVVIDNNDYIATCATNVIVVTGTGKAVVNLADAINLQSNRVLAAETAGVTVDVNITGACTLTTRSEVFYFAKGVAMADITVTGAVTATGSQFIGAHALMNKLLIDADVTATMTDHFSWSADNDGAVIDYTFNKGTLISNNNFVDMNLGNNGGTVVFGGATVQAKNDVVNIMEMADQTKGGVRLTVTVTGGKLTAGTNAFYLRPRTSSALTISGGEISAKNLMYHQTTTTKVETNVVLTLTITGGKMTATEQGFLQTTVAAGGADKKVVWNANVTGGHITVGAHAFGQWGVEPENFYTEMNIVFDGDVIVDMKGNKSNESLYALVQSADYQGIANVVVNGGTFRAATDALSPVYFVRNNAITMEVTLNGGSIDGFDAVAMFSRGDKSEANRRYGSELTVPANSKVVVTNSGYLVAVDQAGDGDAAYAEVNIAGGNYTLTKGIAFTDNQWKNGTYSSVTVTLVMKVTGGTYNGVMENIVLLQGGTIDIVFENVTATAKGIGFSIDDGNTFDTNGNIVASGGSWKNFTYKTIRVEIKSGTYKAGDRVFYALPNVLNNGTSATYIFGTKDAANDKLIMEGTGSYQVFAHHSKKPFDLTVYSGTMTATGNNVFDLNNGETGVITIHNGKFTSKNSWHVIDLDGNETNPVNIAVTINGGEFTGADKVFQSLWNKSPVVINGGKFTSKNDMFTITGNFVNYTINGGEFTSTAKAIISSNGMGNITVKNATFKAATIGVYFGGTDMTITLENNTITSGTEVVYAKNADMDLKLNIVSGTYKSTGARVMYLHDGKATVVLGKEGADNTALKMSSDAELQIFAHHSDPTYFDLTIHSGTYTAKNNFIDINGNSSGEIKIHGGNFTTVGSGAIVDIAGGSTALDAVNVTITGGTYTAAGNFINVGYNTGVINVSGITVNSCSYAFSSWGSAPSVEGFEANTIFNLTGTNYVKAKDRLVSATGNVRMIFNMSEGTTLHMIETSGTWNPVFYRSNDQVDDTAFSIINISGGVIRSDVVTPGYDSNNFGSYSAIFVNQRTTDKSDAPMTVNITGPVSITGPILAEGHTSKPLTINGIENATVKVDVHFNHSAYVQVDEDTAVYGDLSAAINAAPAGATVYVKGNIKNLSTATVNGDLTIEGAGTITATSNIMQVNKAAVINLNGNIAYTTTGKVVYVLSGTTGDVTVNFNKGSYTSTGGSQSGAILSDYSESANVSVYVADGVLMSTAGWAIDFEGSQDAADTGKKKVDIKAATISAAYAIVFNHGGVSADIDINNASITTNTAVYLSNLYNATNNNVVTVDINNLVFNGNTLLQLTTRATHAVINVGGNTIANSKATMFESNALNHVMTVNVTGGTYIIGGTSYFMANRAKVTEVTLSGNTTVQAPGHVFGFHRQTAGNTTTAKLTIQDNVSLTKIGTGNSNVIDVNQGVDLELNIFGGTFLNEGTSGTSNIIDVMGNTDTRSSAKITITGGTFTAAGGYLIAYTRASGEVNLTGGTVTTAKRLINVAFEPIAIEEGRQCHVNTETVTVNDTVSGKADVKIVLGGTFKATTTDRAISMTDTGRYYVRLEGNAELQHMGTVFTFYRSQGQSATGQWWTYIDIKDNAIINAPNAPLFQINNPANETNGVLNISGGTINVKAADNNGAIEHNNANGIITTTITGGSITVTGGPLTGASGSTHTTISGGTISAKYLVNANGTTCHHVVDIKPGANITATTSLVTDGTAGSKITVNIYGGEITTPKFYNTYAMATTVKINILGDYTYNGVLIVLGEYTITNGDGSATYPTLQDAVNAGGEIVISGIIHLTETLNVSTDVVFTGTGTIKYTGGNNKAINITGGSLVNVTLGGDLTLTDFTVYITNTDSVITFQDNVTVDNGNYIDVVEDPNGNNNTTVYLKGNAHLIGNWVIDFEGSRDVAHTGVKKVFMSDNATIDGKHGIVFNVDGVNAQVELNGGNINVTNDAIYLDTANVDGKRVNVKLNGVKINAAQGGLNIVDANILTDIAVYAGTEIVSGTGYTLELMSAPNANPSTLNIYGGYFRADNVDAVVHVQSNNDAPTAGQAPVANLYAGYFEADKLCCARSTYGGVLNIYGGYYYYNCSESNGGSPVRSGTGANVGYVYVYGGNFKTNGFGAAVQVADSKSHVAVVHPGLNAIGGSAYIYANGAPGITSEFYQPGTEHKDAAVSILDGAGVRLIPGSNGLRFVGVVTAEMLAFLNEIGATDIGFGTLIAPADEVEKADAFTIFSMDRAGAQYVKIPARQGLVQSSDGGYYIRAALTDIREENLDRAFAAVTYVTYKVNGQEVITYSSYRENRNSRSIEQVARVALQNPEMYTEAQLEALRALAPTEETAPVIDFYIVAGQSNAAGSTFWNDAFAALRPEYTEGYSNIYYSGSSMSNSNYGAQHAYYGVPVTIGLGNQPGNMGPELGMAQALSQYYNEETGRYAAIIKYAYGGTNLYDVTNYAYGNWTPPTWLESHAAVYDRSGALYDGLVYTLETCVADYRAMGFDVEIKSLYWMQGESDVRQYDADGLYSNIFGTFVTDFRNDVVEIMADEKYADLPFLVGEISEHFNHMSTGEYHDQVLKFIEMQRNIIGAMDGVYIIPNGKIPTADNDASGDNAHWNSYAALWIGQMVGNFVLENLLGEEVAPVPADEVVAEVWLNGEMIAAYDNLQAAVNMAPEGAVVKLIKDITVYSNINIGNQAKITLDGGNHTITVQASATENASLSAMRFYETDITVIDLHLVNESPASGTTPPYGVYMCNEAKVNWIGGSIEAARHGVVMNTANCVWNMVGGEIRVRYSDVTYGGAMHIGGTNQTITLTDVTLTGADNGYTIYVSTAGTNCQINIYGGNMVAGDTATYVIYVGVASTTVTCDKYVNLVGGTNGDIYRP